jgi:UDP-2,3-diacylglucosamine hydrolase
MMHLMPEFDAVLFSDLHLSPKKPRIDELFDAFCDRVAGTPEIACLGDLTEYWIGFPQLKDPHGRHVYDQLARLAKGAKRAIFVGGNRDFLMRHDACKVGYQGIKNVYEGEFAGRRVALEHGDLLCTTDRKYQRFRFWFQNFPWWILQYTIAPQGHKIAQYFRSRSTGETARKTPSTHGIQAPPVERLIKRGAEVIVCGHVHTPFIREYSSNGRTGRLLVTSDWRGDGAVVCTVKNGVFSLVKFDGDRFLPFDAPSAQPENAPAMYNEAEQTVKT